jgi:hypothetical protein
VVDSEVDSEEEPDECEAVPDPDEHETVDGSRGGGGKDITGSLQQQAGYLIAA